MPNSSRRQFLALTGTGAVAATAAAALPNVLTLQRADDPPVADTGDFAAPLDDDLLMACVSDPAAGRVTVVRGANEVSITDPVLVQRISQLSRRTVQ